MLCMSRTKQQKTMFFSYVKDFFDDMRIELKSERTINTYRESLNSFRVYLLEKHSKQVDAITFDFVTDQLIREYIGWVAENSSVGTRNIRLAALKSYVKYISSKNIELVPLQISLSALKSKTVRPKKHNWLDKEQVLLLLDQPLRTRIGIRDRFIILFLFSTGARLSEMLAVKIKDVVLEDNYPYVRLTGKGNKPRIVPVPENAFVENFNYYCELFHPENNPEEYLFYTTIHGRLNPMSEDNVQRILKKHGDSARKTDSSIPSVHPHLLRHSYGAQMYRLGLSLPEVAKLLGHEYISTTEIYAETDIEMAAKALKKMIGTQPSRKWDSLSEDEKLKLLGLK